MANSKVIWITGLSGAGKTSIAKRVVELLKGHSSNLGVSHPSVLWIDGDEIREILGNDLDYSPEDRLKNAYRIAKLCRWASQQGFVVVCSTMSLYHEIHEWNRINIPQYYEVFLKVDLETLRSRDPKGHYRGSDSGKQRNLAGVDISFEAPKKPDLIIDNNLQQGDLDQLASHILTKSGVLR